MPKQGTKKRASAITPPHFKERVGKNLKQIRKEAGLTQTEFGECIGIEYYQVSRYERGLDEISLYLACLICTEFKIELKEITR